MDQEGMVHRVRRAPGRASAIAIGSTALAIAGLTLTGCGGAATVAPASDPATTAAASLPPQSPASEATSGDARGVVSIGEAERAAVAAVGEGSATWSGPENDLGAAWEVEVTRADGSEVDVLVAADGTIIEMFERFPVPGDRGSSGYDNDGYSAADEYAGGADTRVQGGSGQTGSGQTGSGQTGSGQTGSGQTRTGMIDRATAQRIAVEAVGGGQVTWAGREDDRGAAWEIEVTRPDGSEVDVLIDASGNVIR